jgi:hypothetical protein
MSRYYISRAIVAIVFGSLFALAGSPWWLALLIGMAAFAWFLYAPHSGRYAVHPELGVTALRRDERTQVITDKAAKNAFVVIVLALVAAAAYFGAAVPAAAIHWTLVLGVIIYFASDFWLRRS